MIWQDRFSVGIKIIDDHHKVLIDFTNRLYNSGNDQSQGMEVFKKVISEAVEYVHMHFNAEEKLMKYFNYPDYEAHKKAHVVFISRILQEALSFDKNNNNEINVFCHFLRDWLLSHIAIVDTNLGLYLKSLGQK